MNAFLFIFLVIIGYLVGSICSAVIVSRIFSLPDPRTQGSKNPGATNMLRVAGKKYAVLVLVADMLKGLLPVLLAKLLDVSWYTVGFTGLAAVVGHMYPIFFRFKGGKGVATALGILFGFNLFVGLLSVATWLIVANLTRYSSFASILSMLLAPFYCMYIIGNLEVLFSFFFVVILIAYQHRANINRLIEGNEHKIKFKRNTLDDEIAAVLREQEREDKEDKEAY